MERIKYVMEYLNKHLTMLNDMGFVFDDGSFDEMIHSYGVAYFCASAAYSKGLDPELGYIIGLLHDVGRIINDDYTKAHGPSGAILVEGFLEDTGLFDSEEIEIVCRSISKHSKKGKNHGPYDEILKDADLIERLFFMGDIKAPGTAKRKRIDQQLERYGLEVIEKNNEFKV
ncbi:HD domain-containing protein [Dethiosulfatibacter aminovorans]|uniref:HD domain-containing protein n=1 Tax=Dethiosulfatibacter aminovorans TaxID=332095 RepID=UPI000933351F|nr:HD domain-containing protein [Dethiosulfatibacter aminovorans]